MILYNVYEKTINKKTVMIGNITNHNNTNIYRSAKPQILKSDMARTEALDLDIEDRLKMWLS